MKKDNSSIKVDKRVEFTKSSIKDTLLEEIKNVPFEDIGIVGLCDKAQISRSAFYLHFANLSDVLKEVVMDAVSAHCGIIKVILGDNVSLETCNTKTVQSGKYIGLFSDKTASDMLMKYLIENYKDEYTKNVMKEYGLSKTESEVLFYFQTAGIISAASEISCKSLKRWNKLGKFRDGLFEKGIKGVKGVK